MILTEPRQAAASFTVEQWSAYLQDLHARIAHRFRKGPRSESVYSGILER